MRSPLRKISRITNQQTPYGKEDQTESDYVILEQQVQSQSFQNYTEDNLELLTTTKHIKTKTIKKLTTNIWKRR